MSASRPCHISICERIWPGSTWTWAAVAAVCVVLLASCGGSDLVPTPEGAVATATVAPGFGPPITASDVTASLTATRDDRRLWPEGTWGGRIVLKAERTVPTVPGEAVGQGPNRYDAQFLAWDPVANTFATLWTNESSRSEDVLSTAGDWALSELYKNNPMSQWELRLHNMATGETQTIDAEDSATSGTSSNGILGSRIVDGRVLWVTVVIEGGQRVEQLRMFTISTGDTTIIDSAAGVRRPDSGFYPGGIDGNTVAYLRGLAGSARTLVQRSLSGGTERTLAAPPGMAWEAISPGARFAVARQDPAPTIGAGPEGPRFAINLANGDMRRFAEGQSYGHGVDFANGYVSWQVPAADKAVNGFFSFDSGLSRILDPSIPDDGQGARVFDGWFFWRERAPGATPADNDRVNGILRFMRLR